MPYNEVTITSEDNFIELNCIYISEYWYDDYDNKDIVWVNSNQLGLYRVNCNM